MTNAFCFNSNLYSLGGKLLKDNQEILSDALELLEPGSSKWISLSKMPNPRKSGNIVLLNHYCFVFGGFY